MSQTFRYTFINTLARIARVQHVLHAVHNMRQRSFSSGDCIQLACTCIGPGSNTSTVPEREAKNQDVQHMALQAGKDETGRYVKAVNSCSFSSTGVPLFEAAAL